MAAALLPLFALAQEPLLAKDIIEKAKAIQTIKINDNLNAILVEKSDEDFDVIGVDQNMSILWQNSFNGYALKLAGYKGKILAVAATDHAFVKGMNNTYKGFLIDPSSGKTLVEKELFKDTDEFMNYPTILVNNNEFKGIAVRQTSAKRKLRVALPSVFAIISINKLDKELRITQDLDMVQYNDKLEPVNSYKPQLVKDAILLGMQVNAWGDLFISWLVNGSINIYRYEQGQTEAKGIAKSDLQLKEGGDGPDVNYAPSTTNRNQLFYGLFFKDSETKKIALWIGRLDLSSGERKQNIELFDKDHVKAIKKGFVPVNKKLDDFNLGEPYGFDLDHLEENNGVLIASFLARGWHTVQSSTFAFNTSILINAYNTNLEPKFQLLMPSNCTSLVQSSTGYFINNNKLHVIAADGNVGSQSAIHGTADLNNGQWDSMIRLSKKKISGSNYPDGKATLLFADNFALPYINRTGFLIRLKFDVTLQQNSYQ